MKTKVIFVCCSLLLAWLFFHENPARNEMLHTIQSLRTDLELGVTADDLDRYAGEMDSCFRRHPKDFPPGLRLQISQIRFIAHMAKESSRLGMPPQPLWLRVGPAAPGSDELAAIYRKNITILHRDLAKYAK